MNGITITRKVSLSLTADQWGLYMVEGRDRAARCLNAVIETAISGNNREEAEALARRAMRDLSQFGATDSEGYWMMEKIMDAVFGE
jgi:hypothetical protein